MAKKSKANQKSPNQASGQVRIIAGKHRGRKLPVLMADGLRPTTDRVKETVFNWLMPYLYDADCLDCFAGSGSLGFEAISRGVKHCQFFELNSQASKNIASNIKLLNADNAKLSQGDSIKLLANCQQSFDLVFIDPPFRLNLADKVIESLTSNALLNEQALIYIETESELLNLAVPDNWQLLKEKVAGQVAYRLYQLQ